MSDDLKQPDPNAFVESVTTNGSDDLKARIAEHQRRSLPYISLSLLLDDCLKRIEELEDDGPGTPLAIIKAMSIAAEQFGHPACSSRPALAFLIETISALRAALDKYETHDHAPCIYCDPLRSECARLRADMEAAERTIREMCGASEGSWMTALRDAYFQAKEKRP